MSCRDSFRWGRNTAFWCIGLCCALVLAACRVDVDIPQAVSPENGPVVSNSDEPDVALADGELPVLGPIPGSSHWHAAYVVRVCGDVLEPFDSAADPLGIHSHDDGMIHVHPFFVEAGYEDARLTLFLDAMGAELSEGSLTLPGGGTWRDGDDCEGVPGRVFVDKWAGPGSSEFPDRIFENFDDIRFGADRELYQIAFAPADSPPVVPPTESRFAELSAPPPSANVWIDIAPDADPGSVRIWPVDTVSPLPCDPDEIESRVVSGTPSCYLPADQQFTAIEAVVSARAVDFNRRPAVELIITPQMRTFVEGQLATTDALTIAIEIDGSVATVARFEALPLSPNRVVLSGGFDTKGAQLLAALLS